MVRFALTFSGYKESSIRLFYMILMFTCHDFGSDPTARLTATTLNLGGKSRGLSDRRNPVDLKNALIHSSMEQIP